MSAAPAHPFPVSDHCDGRRFFNPRRQDYRGWGAVLKWRMTSRATPWPQRVELAPPPPLPPAPTGDGVAATWIGHATFLLQTRHGALLTDPVYSERAGPFGLAGPRRVHAPGVDFAALPRIAYVLLSHDHYDHCDLATLRRLARAHNPLLIAPLGHATLARRAGLRVVELDWWQTHELAPGMSVTATPARHWSNRIRGARNSRLWCGFAVRAGGRVVQFVGDTGYDDTMFREIRARLGPPDLALVPIGAYEPRWFMSAYHCNPAEAVQIHRELGARQSVAMHWGTWQLTDEGREEPPRALAEARVAAGLPAEAFRVLAPGESVAVL
ncbi:MAG: MBL fold metallo-hydrolase [Opitutae bacterium]|nr:MBL fold metallo-hydrolase [Opitutae bacterium]